ncbi:ERF family protein [Actinocrinis sp.]|uniref:ERF family protein n=1 Tax=Actinocrinis sp. TaxID=1920516 RepID=UPI002D2FFE2B|nr:ERF family protein [Actinocrinis sp.]HZP55009.1 ERF family protein [Actinocrinis sp.]
MGLAENAAALAGEPLAGTMVADEPQFRAAPDLTEPDLGDLTVDGEKVPVVVAWSRVMGEIRAIGKNQNFDGGKAGKFKFRGIEAALNAFGPACRKHGVVVSQHRVGAEYRDISTASGGRMRECTATVTYRIYGPSGDLSEFIECQAIGEASDSGGRSTPKAQSIALRTLLINNGLVPTEDRDADADHFERGEAPRRTAASYLEEIFNEQTSPGRMNQIVFELRQLRQEKALVRNEHGEEEPIGALVTRIGNERFGAPQRPRPAGPRHQGHAEGGYDADCVGCKAEQAEADRAAATS